MDASVEKERVEELKKEWKMLWRDRVDDRVRAEGIASKEYEDLFVDRGTVIVATRDFKALDFKEILKLHKFSDLNRLVGPNPSEGGWGKFIRNFVATQTRRNRVAQARYELEKKKQEQQLKKSGRGWLHC